MFLWCSHIIWFILKTHCVFYWFFFNESVFNPWSLDGLGLADDPETLWTLLHQEHGLCVLGLHPATSVPQRVCQMHVAVTSLGPISPNCLILQQNTIWKQIFPHSIVLESLPKMLYNRSNLNHPKLFPFWVLVVQIAL